MLDGFEYANAKNGQAPSLPAPLQAMLDKLHELQRRAKAQGYHYNETGVRESLARLTRTHITTAPDMGLVADEIIHGPHHSIPIRIYHPAPQKPLPVGLFIHGGGHVAGSVAVYDPIVRKIAATAKRVMVSIEYRRAPEHPYPAGLNDAILCVKKILPTLRALNIPHIPILALVGDSGGGALCATISHLAQFDGSMKIERQVLLYPSLDYTLSRPSVQENGHGYLLEHQRILWMFAAYLQNEEDRRSLSPLFMEVTDAYPPTLLITAQFDPLRDEGISYIEILKKAGITTCHLHLPNMIHAFLNLENLAPDACRKTYETIGKFLGQKLK